jgi:hypothetical protein
VAEDLQINGEIFTGVEFITVRNTDNKDVKYFKGGTGGGGGRNYRVATSDEIKDIFK